MAIRTPTTSVERQDLTAARTDTFVFQPSPVAGKAETVALEHEPVHANEPTLQHEDAHVTTFEALWDCLTAWECNVPDGFYGP